MFTDWPRLKRWWEGKRFRIVRIAKIVPPGKLSLPECSPPRWRPPSARASRASLHCRTVVIFMLMMMLDLWLQAETPGVTHSRCQGLSSLAPLGLETFSNSASPDGFQNLLRICSCVCNHSQILGASPDVFENLLKEWKILGGVHLSQGEASNSFQTWGKGKRKGNKRICFYLSWKIGKNSSTTKGRGFSSNH